MVEENFNFAEVLTVKLFKIVDGIYSKPLANLRFKISLETTLPHFEAAYSKLLKPETFKIIE